MNIPFCEPYIEPVLPDIVAQQVASGWWGPGIFARKLGVELGRLAGCYGYCTVSGTVALSLTSQCHSSVVVHVPAYGVISVPNAFESVNIEVIAVDICKETGCMSLEDLDRTRADGPVCFVDFSGYRGMDLFRMRDYCSAEGLLLIEDAACATPNAPIVGDIATYSFSMPKWIATGQGGAVLTHDTEFLTTMWDFTDHGGHNWRATNSNERIGTNLRFNDILASIGLYQLERLDERIARKQVAYDVLKAKLGDKLFAIPNAPPLHNIVFAQRRDALIGKLNAAGIEARWQYRTICQHPCYKHLTGNYPNADWWTDHAVYLPFGMALTEAQAEQVADAVIASGEELLENHD